MKYKIYKFSFSTALHMGKRNLEEHEYTIHADTLFSALCIEAIKMGEPTLQQLYKAVQENQLLLSDAFPYINDNTYFLPKPIKQIVHGENSGNSVIKKAYKKLKYIPAEAFEQYLSGNLDVMWATELLHHLGKEEVRTFVNLTDVEDSTPYQVGTYHFQPDSGLYVIVGYADDELLTWLEELLTSVSYAGIGGKRSSGLGKFTLKKGKLHQDIQKRLEHKSETYMLLSCALPMEEELEEIMQDAEYLLLKRSGFVYSEKYSESQMRKKDIYFMSAGSCVKEKFSGAVYDVSAGGKHAVYRYGKPMFLGVDL